MIHLLKTEEAKNAYAILRGLSDEMRKKKREEKRWHLRKKDEEEDETD